MLSLIGLNDTNLRIIENRFDSNITVRGDTISIQGDPQQNEQIEKVFKELAFILNKNGDLHVNDVETVIDLVLVNGESAIPRDRKSTRLNSSHRT